MRRGRFWLRVTSSEASGPPGAGSQAEANATVPRPDSGIRLNVPAAYRTRRPVTGESYLNRLSNMGPDDVLKRRIARLRGDSA